MQTTKVSLIDIRRMLEALTVGELRAIEDAAQLIRLRKQDVNLKQLMDA